jgi:polysaccharide biosynthesis PFTS motif protein
VYFNSSPEQVLRALREERFSTRANFQEPLVEVRSMKTFFLPHPNFTYDAPIHILHKVLTRRSYSKLFRLLDKEISNLDTHSVFKLKNFKEYIFDPVLYTLFFSQLGNAIDLITTQSSFFKVPSSFRIINGPKKIMAWYSTNSKPIYASDDKERKGINVDAFKEIVNEHWVWNNGETIFLQSYGIENVIAVGPVIFQDKIIEEKDSSKFVITYFDVTPLQGSVDFYSEKNTTSVLNSIRDLIDYLEVKYPGRVIVQIKPKREYSQFHSKKYISLVKILSKQSVVKRLPASANLYQTISRSDLVLAVPFTSPALLGRELNVNSFYVSIGCDGWDVPTSSDGVSVISQFEDLLKHVAREIEIKFRL